MKRLFLIFVIGFVLILSVSSQLCKRNVIDCTGQCGRFIDEDNDGFCDLSLRSEESLPVAAEPGNVEPIASSPVLDTLKSVVPVRKIFAGSKKVQVSDTAASTEPKPDMKDQHVTSVTPVPVIHPSLDKVVSESSQPLTGEKEKPYALLEISALTLFFYFLSVLLVKTNSIKKATHRKFWNVILLLTFLMSGILGLFLVVQLNYGFVMSWYMDFLELHVDFGIAMAIISIIHIVWHASYYLNLIRKKKIVSPVHLSK